MAEFAADSAMGGLRESDTRRSAVEALRRDALGTAADLRGR